MIISRTALNVVLASLMAAGLGLTACDKAADSGAAVGPDDSGASAGNASTVPGLPFLAKPVFSPDLVDMMGGLDLFAVAEARLASTQSANAKVKAFATRSSNAHSKSLSGLGAAIEASGQTLSMPDAMTGDLQSKVAALQKLTGPAFDKAYLADQSDVENAEATALRFYSKHGDTSQFKNFANTTAPLAEGDLSAVQALQASVK